MDPLTLSGAFATIVGLLANFKAERSSSDLSDFILWLREQHQEHLAQAIAQNNALSVELSTLLATNHDELVARLAMINNQISVVVSKIDGFSGLVRIFNPPPALSPQAKSVLKQIIDSGAESVLEHKLSTGEPTKFIMLGNAGGPIQYAQPRFINEDFEALVDQGLLRLEHTSKGSRRFLPTRAGVAYAADFTDA